MSRVLIAHNPPWIGIPESWPFGDWQSSGEWADALVGELETVLGAPEESDRESLRDYLVHIADTREERAASRSFIWIDGWTNPTYLADATMIPAVLTTGISIEQLAGADDTDVVEAPIIEEFVSHAGMRGVSSVRYTTIPDVGALLVRADYVWPIPDGYLRLYTAQFDLVAFELVKPKLLELAGAVSLAP